MLRTTSVLVVVLMSMGMVHADLREVETDNGAVSGVNQDGVHVFKGIPYAAPPVSGLRWKAPQHVTNWDGVRACEEFSDDCPHPTYPPGSLYYREPRPQSEDCLYLNVWTAANDNTERRPVMVWIHGGGLTRGSGSTPAYDGTMLAKKGVILVTINYRLGVFGFMAHPDLTLESGMDSSGNYGMLDMIAALKWVRKNIDEFGGDPKNVTIFGESAGSLAVNYLIGSPLAKGLFHKAIGQSGAAFSPMAHLATEENGQPSAEQGGVEFLNAVGATSLDDLRTFTAEEILDVFVNDPEGKKFRTRANVDGYFLTASVNDTYMAGDHNDVPVIVGSNRDELTAFIPEAMVPKTVADYEKLINAEYEEDAAQVLEMYPAKTDADVKNAFIRIRTDAGFGLSMRTWARKTAQGESPAFQYYFTRVPPVPNSEYYGAFHAAEIRYAFHNVHQNPDVYNETDKAVSETMSNYWVNFAKTGDPNGEGLTKWPAYTIDTEAYMDLGDTAEAKTQLNKEKTDLWEKRAGW